jgi:hypothetical protein
LPICLTRIYIQEIKERKGVENGEVVVQIATKQVAYCVPPGLAVRSASLYPYRTVGGDCHHRHIGGDASTGVTSFQGNEQAPSLPFLCDFSSDATVPCQHTLAVSRKSNFLSVICKLLRILSNIARQ